MLDLTSTSLLALTISGAILSVAALVALSLRSVPHGVVKKGVHALSTVAAACVGQLFAILSVALIVNNSYGFYTSWTDVVGNIPPTATISAAGLVPSSQGTASVFYLRNLDHATNDHVIVWLPPQYRNPAYAHYRFPLVTFLPGDPGSPLVTFQQFEFAAAANRAIESGQVPPFVGLFPTMTIQPGHDTECTDIPRGPRALNWLADTVPQYVQRHFRVMPPGAAWTAMGFSTGGFCAAKLVLRYPRLFGSAVAFGAYYTPIVTAPLARFFTKDPAAMNANSPLWLYRRNGLGVDRLLVVSSRQDASSWPESRAMLAAANGDAAVSGLVFPQGGHNFGDYRAYLGAALAWSAQTWGVARPHLPLSGPHPLNALTQLLPHQVPTT